SPRSCQAPTSSSRPSAWAWPRPSRSTPPWYGCCSFPRSCTCWAGRTGGCPDRSTGGFPSCGSRDVPRPSPRVRGPRRTTPAAASWSREAPPSRRAPTNPVRGPPQGGGPRTDVSQRAVRCAGATGWPREVDPALPGPIIRSRHGYRDCEAAAGPGLGGHGAVVCRGDGCDDGQAEAEAVGGGAAVEPLERLEQGAEGGPGDDRAGVGDGQGGLPVHRVRREPEVAARGVVPQGVVDQVRDHALQEHRVA